MNLAKLHARIVFTLLLLVLAACGGGERAAGDTASTAGGSSRTSGKPLTIRGSDTMVILGQRFAEEYMKANPGSLVQVNGGGSGTGIAAMINGTTDLAQSSRPMKGDELASAEKSRGAKVVELPVALDALAVFVHSANPVKELTIEQIAGVYTGKTKNWRELGGPDAPIIVYGRENSSGTYDYFKEHVLNKADFAPTVQTLQGTAAIINAVGRDKNGIGYGGIAYAQEVRAIAIRKDAASPAVTPSEATVADNTYPLSRKLFFYYPANAPERVTKFAQWTLTPAGQQVVTGVGYFPLSTTASAGETTTATAK
jgi:phosphate transport system substrate-binding protein